MEKTTVGYAAKELGISRQLVHVYIKKGLIRFERSGQDRTAPLILENADVKALLGTERLKIAHAQRARLLGKKKTRKVPLETAGTAGSAAGAADEAAGSAASAAGTAEAATLSGAASV